jgi:ligand-binding sensor domain-containing protein/DNA-binding CsgD family transcriptional regulator
MFWNTNIFRITVLFFLFLVNSGRAQDSGIPPLYVDHLTISDGLSHNTVHCLLQDRHGYFWVGTQHGLNKYDGYSFETISSDGAQGERTAFAGKKITDLFEDRSGNLWVGTSKYGINYRSANSDQFVNRFSDTIFTAIKGHEITSFFEDQAGHIWITTIEAGLLRYDPMSGDTHHYTKENSSLSSDVVFDVVEDKYGTIWVAAAGGGLNFLGEDNRFQLSHTMLANNPNMSGFRKRLFLDDEYLWIGTEGTGLYRMNCQDRSYIHFAAGKEKNSLSSNGVRDIYKTESGHLFIATDGGGLNVYDPISGEFSVYTNLKERKKGLNSNALYCFWGDRTGNIWIGTYNGGINIFKPGKIWFERFAPNLVGSEELQNRSILSLMQSSDGKIWIGSDGGGLNWISPEDNRFSMPPFKNNPSLENSISGNIVKTLFEDSNEQMWVGVFGEGLDRYNPATEKFDHILTYPTSVWSIAERKNGKLWIATMGDGIVVLDPETLERSYYRHDPNDPNSLVDLSVMVVFVDRDDQVFLGTANHGLDIWVEDQEKFMHFQNDPNDPASISNNEIRAIFQDRSGNIWIGTEGGGLNRWLGEGKFERIGVEEGLITNSVMGITEDIEGMLWVTTFGGISRLNPKTGAIQNFDFRNPHNANQFNQSAILTTTNGKLFFGGINGLNAIHPNQVKNKKGEAEVIFTNFKIFNREVKAGVLPDGRTILERPIEEAEHIQLNYLDKSFSFGFSAIDYTSPLDHQYTYKMEGFDDRWQETAAGQNSVSYTNLDPGNYTFKVKYLDQVAAVDISIEPPFWKKNWFRITLGLLIVSLISGGVYFMMKRKEAAHKRQLLQLQNEKLASEVETKTSKLMFSAMQIAHKNEILTDLKNDLLKEQKKSGIGLGSLVRKLDLELMNEDHWKEFDIYFNQVDQDFFQSLLANHPKLTKNDLRMCSLIRINLNTKEIAFLLNVSTRAVEQGRYRLKKRLGLEKEDDLDKYITGFNTNG